MQTSNRDYSQIALLLISISLVISFYALFFQQFPTQNTSLAMDWKTEWAALRGANLEYLPEDGVRFPPWSLLPLLPLGLLPMKIGWGLLAGIGVCILVASVPQTRSRALYWLSVLLLLTSFPSIRVLVDGNMEAIGIAGVALLLYSYRTESVGAFVLGFLLATIKVQAVSLLIVIVSVYALMTWQKENWSRAGIITSVVIALSLIWRGKDWFVSVFGPNYDKYTGSIIDISVSAALNRLGFVPSWTIAVIWTALLGLTLFVAWKTKPTLTRFHAGTFIAASILLSPYASGNSVLILLAIGVITLFQTRQWLGLGLIMLFNVPYLWTTETLFSYQAYYWSTLVFIAWVVFIWSSLSNLPQRRQSPSQKTDTPRSVPT